MLLPTFILDSAVASRGACAPAGGALVHLVRSLLQQPCRTAASLADNQGQHPYALQASCSIRGCSNGVDSASILSNSLACWNGLGAHAPLPLLRHHHLHWQGWPQGQPHQRGISSTPSTRYKFDSHLTRYNKSKVANRDNFQRFRDSGRDARVAADILREGDRAERRGGRGGRGGSDDALLELRSLVHECRDLRAMQVLVRECANDMDPYLVSSVLGRLAQLKQDTPAAAAPDVLARRVADALMARLEVLADESSPSNFAHAFVGLANCGLVPSRPLLIAAIQRLSAVSPRGSTSAAEADPKVVSKLLSATAKFVELVKAPAPSQDQQQQQQQQQQRPAGREGAGTEPGEEGVEALLRTQLWPLMRAATEVKLLRALGEEAQGGGRRRRGAQGGAEEEDDSMPQTALRFTCFALAAAREAHAGTWTAATRLAARHSAELQPNVAAGVLRSYAVAGGAALDGGEARLADAVWGALGPQVDGLEVEAQLDLLLAMLKLAAAKGGASAAAADDAGTAAAAVPVLCGVLAQRVPALSVSDATHLVIALAELHTRTISEAVAAAAAADGDGGAAAPWQTHSYGALPRLLADLLVLRGVSGFGASRFGSIALGLGLLGHADAAFWSKVAAAALPEVSRMDSTTLSRLLGGFHTAAMAAEVTAAAGVVAAVPSPGPALLAAAHTRIRTLLAAGDVFSAKPLFHMVRALAEWPMPEESGGEASTVTVLVDRLEADEAAVAEATAAPRAVRQRLAAALQRVGLGEHALIARLTAPL